MASPIALTRTALLRNSFARSAFRPASYATHANPSFSVSQTSSGIRVASNDGGSPTSAITVAIKAGSRYEPAPGIAHAVKNFVFKNTSKRSALRVVREAELAGGVLSSSLSREHLFLTAEFLRGNEPLFAELLGDVLTSSTFEDWEFHESVVPQLAAEYQQAISQPSAYALDLAHQLAFRNGLGNSLFASPNVAVSSAEAASFARRRFAVGADVAVLGTGVDGKQLDSLVGDLFAVRGFGETPQGSAATTTYHGGESRVPLTAHGSSDIGHYLLGYQGGSLADPAFAVLKHLLGGQSSVKWSAGISPLSKLTSPGASVDAFNLAYSDAGLFGFYVTAPTNQVENILKQAVAELKKAASGVSEEDLKRAINKAKFEAASGLEERVSRLELTGAQVLATGPLSAEQVFANLDAIKAADVAKAASSALKSKPTSVALGDTHKLPWADQVAS